MKSHTENTNENKRESVSNNESKTSKGTNSTFQFVDNRPEAVAQRKMKGMLNNSIQNKQAIQLQKMVNNGSTETQQTIQKKENNTGLPDNLKTGMENLSGMSMDDVKVHRNSAKPAQLQAHAYAQGTDIHLGPGQEKHLPHEAWHVVQQKEGRVKPTMQMKGKVNVNDDAGLEKEADVMGAEALQMKSNYSSIQLNKKNNSADTVQRVDEFEADNISKNKERKRVTDIRSLENEATEHILKFNFAGSSEEEWATHAPKKGDTNEVKDEKLKARGDEAEHQSGGKKYSRKKDDKDISKIVFEYAGPLNISGMFDMGANNTDFNIKDAKGEFEKFMGSLVAKQYAHDKLNVQINIKGFSRGAATATEFADWIKQSKYGEYVDVNLVVFDPVHGSNLLTGGDAYGLMAKRKAEQDVSSVYNENEEPGISGTTYVFPVKSGYENLLKGFTVQKVSGYQRVIIGYGQHASHSFGVKGFINLDGKPIKGMKLSTLPQGLFIAEATSEADLAKGVNPKLQQITSFKDWQKHEYKITGEAKSLQNRDDAVRAAAEKFFPVPVPVSPSPEEVEQMNQNQERNRRKNQHNR